MLITLDINDLLRDEMDIGIHLNEASECVVGLKY